MSQVFRHGDLRLYLLSALAERPRHGYEIMRLLEDRFFGLYTPSAGTIYPRLAALEDDGLVEHEEIDGRKVFSLTVAGEVEVEARKDEIAALEARVDRRAHDATKEIRSQVRKSVNDLRQDIRRAVHEVRHEERRAREAVRDSRSHLRDLRAELDLFVSDVLRAAGRHSLPRERIDAVRQALREARDSVKAALRS